MEPASIITCIETALGVCSNVVSLVQAIKDVKELPEAFQQLENKMALVETILKKTRGLINISTPNKDREVAKNAIESCQEQIEHLQGILQTVQQNSGDSKGESPKLWSSIKKFYRNAVLRLGKGSKGRVEDLTRGILESLRLLSTWCGLEDQLKKAVDDINSMEASLEDQECDPTGTNVLNIGGNVHGNPSAQSFGDNYVDSHAPGSFHVAGSHGPVNLADKIENHTHHYQTPVDKPELIKKWLLDLAKYLTFEEVQHKMLQSATKTPGAGKWFTKSSDFKAWRDGQARKFFGYGNVGTGKTVLMSLVIDNVMSKSGVFCIYAFLDRSSGEAQNLTNLLSTLLIQLIERGKGICDAIEEKYEEFKRSRLRPTTKVYIVMLKSQMEFLASRTRRIYFIVDALDQCDDETLPTFLKACEEFPPNVRMLFTSTYNNNEIVDLIKPDKSMEICAHNQDIRAYLKEAFDTNKYLQKAIKNSELSYQDQVLSTVVQKSQRNFLLATLHLRGLISYAKLFHSLENCLKGLSGTPDEFYKKALDRSKQEEPLISIIISWLVFAERPITVDELDHAMNIQRQLDDIKNGRCVLPKGNTLPSLEYTLKHVCAGIVEVDVEERIHFEHSAAEMYFRKNEAEMLRGAQTMITDVCLACLRHVPPGGPAQSIPSVEALVERCKQYPLLGYAADHWGHHLLFKEQGKHDVNLSAWQFLADAGKLKNATQIMLDFEFRLEEAVSGIHVAAYFGLVELIRKAKKNDRSIDTNACTTRRQESVLHWAVTYQQHEFLGFLIENGAFLTSQDYKGRTALYVAVEMEDLWSVETLLSPKGPRREQHINIAQKMRGWAPLHCAAHEGKSKIVEKLLDAGAEVNKPDNDGFTPLCLAFQQGYLRIVELLVDKKASLEITYADGKQWSLLERSAAEGRDTVMRLLIEKRVDLNASVTDDGKTPLRLALEYDRRTITWLLIEAHVDIDKSDSEGKTPLYWAAENCQLFSMWILLAKNASTTAAPSQAEKMTPLHIAALKGHESAVLLLLTMGADPFQRDINSHTSLYWAIIEGHKEVVQLLLLKVDAQRLIHDRDDEERTALHHAACQGYLEISKMLLSYGADSNAKDVYGNTALQLAHNGGHEAVYEHLLRLGSDVNFRSWATMTIPATELQDEETSKSIDNFDAESIRVESLAEEELDTQWFGDTGSDTDNAEVAGRFRARVEDYYEDE